MPSGASPFAVPIVTKIAMWQFFTNTKIWKIKQTASCGTASKMRISMRVTWTEINVFRTCEFQESNDMETSFEFLGMSEINDFSNPGDVVSAEVPDSTTKKQPTTQVQTTEFETTSPTTSTEIIYNSTASSSLSPTTLTTGKSFSTTTEKTTTRQVTTEPATLTSLEVKTLPEVLYTLVVPTTKVIADNSG